MTDLAPPLPRELQVEVTGACNLRCHMCLVRYQPPIDKVTGSMCLHTFVGLLDALPELDRVTLQGLGEPLMAPDLMGMIRAATARGISVGFNTNGTLLTRAKAEELIDAELSWLHISVDGATPTTYEAIRDRGRFDRVARNIAGLVEAMREKGVSQPLLRVVFVAQRSNYRELPALVRLVADWGIRELRVQNLSHDFSDTDPTGAYGEIRRYALAEALWGDAHEDALRVFDQTATLAEDLGIWLRLPDCDEAPDASPRAPGTAGCDWPWRSAYVTHDAKVQPCCMIMGSDRAVLGDAGRHDLATIWGNDSYSRFRARLLSNDDPPDVCRGCSWYRGVF